MGTSRETALNVLYACHRQGAWVDGALKRELGRAGLDSRDAAQASYLAYGVEQNRLLLDYYLAHYCTRELEGLEPRVLDILRLGAFQLLFAHRIPAMAAVDESVKLARKWAGNPRAAGFVNGILRTLERERDKLPPLPGGAVERLSVQYSHPEWLVKEFNLTLGLEETEALLAAHNAPGAVSAQVNTLKTNGPELLKRLEGEGMAVTAHPWMEDCLLLEGTGNLEQSPCFQEGLFYIQDAAARLAVAAAAPRPGMRVLDACAAPGGKSFAAALLMKGEGDILSCDIHANKVRAIEAGAARLGLELITAEVKNAKAFDSALAGQFDLVMADVPCSGLGIIRKKPDIRYKEPAGLAGLPRVQLDILENVCRYVKPGGKLLYATCTVLERENAGVVERFLERHGDFSPSCFQLSGWEGERAQATLWPHRHGTDGFYFALLRRAEEGGQAKGCGPDWPGVSL